MFVDKSVLTEKNKRSVRGTNFEVRKTGIQKRSNVDSKVNTISVPIYGLPMKYRKEIKKKSPTLWPDD